MRDRQQNSIVSQNLTIDLHFLPSYGLSIGTGCDKIKTLVFDNFKIFTKVVKLPIYKGFLLRGTSTSQNQRKTNLRNSSVL